MFKKFLLVVCGSFVGSFIAILIAGLCMVALSFSIMLSVNKIASESISDNSVMVLDLTGVISERAGGEKATLLQMLQDVKPAPSLDEIEKAMEVAKTDDRIKGLLVKSSGACYGSPEILRSVRKAIQNFKSSGKWVYSYANEGYSQAEYYMASAADSVFLNPYGALDIHGLASVTPYFKSMLDKVGVEIQVVRVGSYKSAVEPYILDEMSPENREQQELYLGNIWKTMEGDMAKSRGMKVEKLNELIDSITVTRDCAYLMRNKLIDGVCYRPQFTDKLKTLLGVESTDDINVASISAVASNYDAGKNKDGIVAVVYAVGEIDGSQDGIDSEELVDVITDLKKDDDVKALVLRVNSPGGSAFGSEQIWKALDDFKKSGKVFTVSMGAYAASGGYYISCGAQQIFADSTTVTGSIGIFGVIPCAQDFVENKLGVHIQTVKTNENADMMSEGILARKLNPVQLQSLQNFVNAGYDTFTKRCADGRGISQDSVKVIAQGRVWDGISAKKIGLIDQFGSLQDAINWTAKKANLNTGYYCVKEYPSLEFNFFDALKKGSALKAREEMKEQMGVFYDYYQQLQTILNRRHVLCIMEDGELK